MRKWLISLGKKSACGLGILLKPAPLKAFSAVKWRLFTTLSTVGVDICEKRFKYGRLAVFVQEMDGRRPIPVYVHDNIPHMKKLFAFALLPLTVAATAAPARLQLPAERDLLSVYSMEFSADGDKVCIAGTVSTEMGESKGMLMLVDRARNVLLWRASFPPPDEFAGVYPVQCAIAGERVYLLANVDTDSSPPNSKTLAYVYRFDVQGKNIAHQRLPLDSAYTYGYALDAAPDGVKVAGYGKDVDADFEYYSVYSLSLSPELAPQGKPLIRKSGAYVQFNRARIVGDSLYVTGVFYPAKVARQEVVDDFAASRLRLSGGYTWSAHSGLGKGSSSPDSGVTRDGSIHTLNAAGGATTLLTVNAAGRIAAQIKYPSSYCDTSAIAAWGAALIAVREPCAAGAKDKSRALVSVDTIAGKEKVLDWFGEEPLYVASKGPLWAALARDKSGRLYFYSAASQ